MLGGEALANQSEDMLLGNARLNKSQRQCQRELNCSFEPTRIKL
jgi:hypothetical protein